MLTKLILFVQIHFCIWTQATATSATNVALNKIGLYCQFQHLSEKVFDGITDIRMFESLTGCLRNEFIDVDLTSLYSIQYVVVYEGRGINTGQLDYFIVYNVERDKQVKCSEYPGPTIGAINGSGMRVNCKPPIKLFSKVRIESRKNDGLYISEIEVHSLGSSGKNVLLYRGCFGFFNGSLMLKEMEMCIETCSSRGYLLTAFKNKTECYCGRSYDNSHEIPASECGIKCDDRDYFCGGVEAYSVYLIQVILPSYHGCIEMEDPEDVYTDPDMTIEKCLQHCDNSRYALLFVSENCVCKNYVNCSGSNLFYKSCMTRCIGNFGDYCGGERHASVYQTCKGSDNDLSCPWLVRCNGRLDMYGNCIGTCLPTFKGEFCIEKVLPTSRCATSDPCGKRAYTECIDYEGMAYCDCLSGYALNRSNMKCEDINECDYGPCDDSLSTCVNLEGSMTCDCKRGFVSIADFCTRNKTSYDLKEVHWKEKSFYVLFALPPLVSILIMAFLTWYNEPRISNE